MPQLCNRLLQQLDISTLLFGLVIVDSGQQSRAAVGYRGSCWNAYPHTLSFFLSLPFWVSVCGAAGDYQHRH